MKKLMLAMYLLALPIAAFALPTPLAQRLAWDEVVDPDVTGFMLYYDQEVTSPRTYIDTRRVDLGLIPPVAGAHEIVVISVKPDASSRLCFVVTAYDLSGNESAFSNEACGFFGLPEPENVRVQ